MKLISGFQGHTSSNDVCINADDVVALTERFVVGGVYCEVYLRGGTRVDVWGRLSEVTAKLEGK